MKRNCKYFNMFYLFAIIMFIIGFINIYEYKKTLKNNIKVKGELVDFHYITSSKGFSSSLYTIFKYKIDGIEYTEEYRYEAVNKSEIESKNIISNSSKKIKEILKKSIENTVEYKKGQIYDLIVDKNNHKSFYIEGQYIFLNEIKWFIMGIFIITIIFQAISMIVKK